MSIILPQPMQTQPASWGQINLGHRLLNGATLLAVPTFGRTWSRNDPGFGRGLFRS